LSQYKNRIRVFLTQRILAKLAGGAASLVPPRLGWMILTNPTIKAPAFSRFLFLFAATFSLYKRAALALGALLTSQKSQVIFFLESDEMEDRSQWVQT
jgi:hypothetical protein